MENNFGNLQSVFWVSGVCLHKLAGHNFLALAEQCEQCFCWVQVVAEKLDVDYEVVGNVLEEVGNGFEELDGFERPENGIEELGGIGEFGSEIAELGSVTGGLGSEIGEFGSEFEDGVEVRVEVGADVREPGADENDPFASEIDHIVGKVLVVHTEVTAASNRSPLAGVELHLVRCCSHFDLNLDLNLYLNFRFHAHFRCYSSWERRQCLHYLDSSCYWKCDWDHLEIGSHENRNRYRRHFGSKLTRLRRHLVWRCDRHLLVLHCRGVMMPHLLFWNKDIF